MVRIIALLILMLSYSLFVQNSQGEVIYKTHRKVDVRLYDNNVNAKIQKQLQEMYKKKFQKEFG